MKILFLVYHGFSEHSGISKKIHYQVKGLKENGHDVSLCYYDFSPQGHRCRFVDGEVIKDYGRGRWATLWQRMDYSCVSEYCRANDIRLVYARSFMNASPFTIHLFKRLKRLGIRTVMEVPTYPYDKEFETLPLKYRLEHVFDKMFRRRLASQMDAIVTFSDAEEIFGQRTIRISNGVDFDSTPLHSSLLPPPSTFHPQPSTFHPQPSTLHPQLSLHLIGVAEVHPWHGFDRVMTGLGEYKGSLPVCFHLVGGVHPDYMKSVFAPVIEHYHLQEKVIFHGQLFGEALDAVFSQCQFAVGSLGRHRSGITVIKTLKNREYATRGIPFIYSEQDSDFDSQPYVLKAPADESPIDIQAIVDFMKRFAMQPADIRRTVEHLTWKIQMQKVVDAIAG